MNTPQSTLLDARSKLLRKTVVDTVAQSSNRGHIASAFSLIEIVRVLYDQILKVDPKAPNDPDRDRFILSKGHGCLGLYSMLFHKGFLSLENLQGFCLPNGILGGHPEKNKVPGVEASTGSLGHGLPIGLGMALAAAADGKNHRCFVLMGDGETNEGSVWEAALIAGKHKLSNLTVLIDYNKYQSSGSTEEIQTMEPFASKWNSFGFHCREVNGHSIEDLEKTLKSLPFEKGKPSAIICHTVKGKGVRKIENDLHWHHKNTLTTEEVQMLYNEIEGYQ